MGKEDAEEEVISFSLPTTKQQTIHKKAADGIEPSAAFPLIISVFISSNPGRTQRQPESDEIKTPPKKVKNSDAEDRFGEFIGYKSAFFLFF